MNAHQSTMNDHQSTMNDHRLSIHEQYRSLNMIYVVLLLGAILFAGITVFLVITYDGGLIRNEKDTLRLLKYILLILFITMIPASYLIHYKRLKKMLKIDDTRKKILYYRESIILQFIIFETVCYYNIILFSLSGDYFLLVPAALLITWLAFNKPGINKITRELHLTPEETEKIRETV